MKIGHEYDRYRSQVQPALKSKLDEFRLLGYETINEQALWNYLTKKKWRKVQEDIKLYEVVQDIMSVNVGEYMNFATIEAFKKTEFSFDNNDELKELLK